MPSWPAAELYYKIIIREQTVQTWIQLVDPGANIMLKAITTLIV